MRKENIWNLLATIPRGKEIAHTLFQFREYLESTRDDHHWDEKKKGIASGVEDLSQGMSLKTWASEEWGGRGNDLENDHER